MRVGPAAEEGDAANAANAACGGVVAVFRCTAGPGPALGPGLMVGRPGGGTGPGC